LHWRAGAVEKASATGNLALTARLTVRHDFQPVADALNTLMQGTPAGVNSLFDDQPFDSLSMMRALFVVLGIEALRCCDAPPLPAPSRMEPAVATVTSAGEGNAPFDLFERYCGTCLPVTSNSRRLFCTAHARCGR
jgi:hypothetical protein